MEGLAATLATTNTYGSGEGQNTKHHYAGTEDKKKSTMKKKCKPKGK